MLVTLSEQKKQVCVCILFRPGYTLYIHVYTCMPIHTVDYVAVYIVNMYIESQFSSYILTLKRGTCKNHIFLKIRFVFS